jgi:hypothetical protein
MIMGIQPQSDTPTTDGNRINIPASQFCQSVTSAVTKAYRLNDALETMRHSFIENVNTWEKGLFEDIALEMVGPMNRVHRWNRHQGIIQIRQATSKAIDKHGAPWWKCWKWRYRSAARRRVLRAEMLPHMWADARVSTSELAHVYVDTIANGSNSKFGITDFRNNYEADWSNGSVPQEISLNAFDFLVRIHQPSTLRTSVYRAPDLTCDYALNVLSEIKQTLDAASVWPESAVIDVPVAFVNNAKSIRTLVHQPLLNVMKELYALSMDRLNMPLPIPPVARRQLSLPRT